MNNIFKLLARVTIAAGLFSLLIACSKITQTNFDKIKPNMTTQEVIAILGEPTNSESINIAGISGTSAVWKDKNAEIDIQFLNDRVTVKAFSKDGESSTNEQQPGKKH